MSNTRDFGDAVHSQPAALEQSRLAVGEALSSVDLEPWRSGVLALVAMGASSHAGHAFVHRLRRHGRRAVNIDASEVLAVGPSADVADSFVFVSEGGRSRETVQAAQRVPGGARLGLTNEPGVPLTGVVDTSLAMNHGPDSKVYTVGYTATLQALGLLAAALDGADEDDDWFKLPDLVHEVLEDLQPQAERVAERLSEVRSIDLVGAGVSRASATEGALLVRESARICTGTYETYQYLHGPMESLTGHNACVLFGDEREVSLAAYLSGVGVPTVLITSREVEESACLSTMRIPAVPDLSRSILEMLPVQLVAGELARLRHLGIDGFLYHQDDTKIDGR
jgi:fructoselysine-6-P-deglycase FrlB-like protein